MHYFLDPYKLWPKPKSFEAIPDGECALPSDFRFESSHSSAESCHMIRLNSAIDRANENIASIHARFTSMAAPVCQVSSCSVRVKQPSAPLSIATPSESYEISFGSDCQLSCTTVYGCIAGLSTFVQLVNPVRKYLVPSSFRIIDEPSFSHRGLLLDTSRHFLPTNIILKHIETMAMTKLNVLHWHIVDDHSFPFQSSTFPDLARVGAFAPSATYSHADIRLIVDFAADRGIRVIPEIDIPGHTSSWMRAHPELLGRAKSALDPTRDENYDFIQALLTEVRDVFKSDLFEGPPVIHVGGDETWDGWDTDEIRSWMTEHGMTTNKDLIQYWMRRISGIAKTLNIKLIMWEDFLETVNDDTSNFSDDDNHISWQTWRRNLSASIDLSNRINRNVIFSTDFYLDHLDLAWSDLYAVDIQQAPGLLGAEACMWGEVVDESNIYTRVWPRAAAVAERLWCGSQCALKASVDATVRLARWRCRMIHFFRFPGMEPIGSVQADSPDTLWTYHTDREQWWCEEADL